PALPTPLPGLFGINQTSFKQRVDMGRAEFPAVPECVTCGVEQRSLNAAVDVDMFPTGLSPEGRDGGLQRLIAPKSL
ncbi:hypothetical protein ABTK83_19770, partial [Acinetobacter baumannii]